MTRKDYEMIAKVLHKHYLKSKVRTARIIDDLDHAFGEDNPKFNHFEFRTDCVYGTKP